MLERKWPSAAETQFLRGAEAERERISFADITAFVRRYLVLILAMTAAGLLLAVLYAAQTEPVYRARTEILIEPKLPQFLREPQAADVHLSLDTAQIASQMAVLQSEKIARLVIDELKLEQYPEFNGTGQKSMSQRIAADWDGFGSWLGIGKTSWFKAIGHFASSRLAAMGLKSVPAKVPEFERERRTMTRFTDALGIQRIGVSYAIEISFISHDAERAAAVANAVAKAFIEEQLETKSASTNEGLKWLEARIGQLREQMNTATEAVQAFRAKHDYRIGAVADTEDTGVRPAAVGATSGRTGQTLEELQVTADTYRKMYESFLQAYTTSVNQQPYVSADARVITAAQRPLSPNRPRKKLIIVFGGFAGLMLGFGLAFTRQALDRTLKSPQQIRSELGLECIGELPPVFGRRGGFGHFDEVERSRHSHFRRNMEDVRATIAALDLDPPLRSFGVASASPGEGKSSLATNLAILWARSGKRVLVIDADIYNSALTRRLIKRHETSEAEEAENPIEQIKIHIESVSSGIFEVLPSATVEAYDLLTPSKMQWALDGLSAYDMVIIDLPPLTSGLHGLRVASVLDGVLVAVECGKTPSDLVNELVLALYSAKATIFGVVMTKVRFPSLARFRKLARQSPR